MQELFSLIRKSCSPKQWSQGVELTRSNKIYGNKDHSGEIQIRVPEKGRAIAPIVTFVFEDEEWGCDCDEQLDPCTHVIAAIIALKAAKTSGQDLFKKQENKSTIGYRFKTIDSHLHLERVLVKNGKTQPFARSLSAIASGRVAGPDLDVSKEDLEIDLAIGDLPNGLLNKNKISALFKALQSIENIRLQGKPVKVTPQPTGFIARIVDWGNGVKIYGLQDPTISAIFRNGAALCKNVLKPVRQSKLSPAEIKLLAEGKTFGQKEMVDLVSELIPNLQKKIMIELCCKNLPITVDTKPRIEIHTEEKNQQLTVLAKLVYGDPIIAEVQNDHLVVLNDQVPLRKIDIERQLCARLGKELGLSPNRKAVFSSAQAVQFVKQLEKWEGDLSASKAWQKFKEFGSLIPHFSVRHEKGELFFDCSFQSSNNEVLHAQPEDVLQAFERNESMVPLSIGGFARIPTAWLAEHANTILALLEARNSEGKLPNFMMGDLSKLAEQTDLQEHAQFIDQVKKSRKALEEDPCPIPLPKDLQVTLRDYQKVGVDWLQSLKRIQVGALLADDMGLGKTLQTICILEKHSLIVAPTSVLYNWEKEIQRFRPSLKVNIYHGSNREILENADIVLTTYSILRIDQEIIKKTAWDVMVLDEAQNIKNPESLAAKAACSIKAAFKVALSGTPIENRLDDVWSQFQFLNPGLLGNRKRFQKTYIRGINNGDGESAELLRNRLQPFILRRLKKEVAKELPPRTERVLYCQLSEEERKIYKAIQATTRKEVLDRLQVSGNIMQALEALLRLRQAACHPALIPGQEALESSKTSILISTLKECIAANHKSLVFSQWTGYLDLIAKAMDKEGIKYSRIDGSTINRKKIVENFQKTEEHSVMLLSLKAAGVGLNLTAADHVFIVDPWWNPAAEQQAADRAHRIGQTKPVLIQKLVAKGTVEEKILNLQEKKKELANTIVGSSKGLTLTKEDLMQFFDELSQ